MKLLLIIVALLTLPGCQNQGENKEVEGTKAIAKEVLIWQQAKVVKLPQLSGTFGLINSQGEKLLPINLPKEFKREGAIVNILGSKQPQVLMQAKWGVPFRIQQINLLKN